jgi:RNA polymerase sigma-70 factor (ECF subfamily)
MVDTRTADVPAFCVAFQTIARETQPFLLRRANSLERSETRAWDLVQDTYERGLAHFGQFQPGTNPRAWLLSIMTNLFIDRCRHRTREWLSDPSALSDVPAPRSETLPLWRSFELEDVQAAATHLAPHFQAVLDLHLTRRCSYAQIAEHLGIPCSTVGTRLNRARRMLRALLVVPASEPDRAPPGRRHASAPLRAARPGRTRGPVRHEIAA